MQNQREEALIRAFRKLGRDQQDLYLDAICDCAIEREALRPKLRLVSAATAFDDAASLHRLAENS